MLRRRKLEFAVLFSVAAAISCASAAGVSAETIGVVDRTAVVLASPGEVNHALITEAGPVPPSSVRVSDVGAPLIAGSGCAQTDGHTALCVDDELGLLGLLVNAGDGDDSVYEESAARPVILNGGSGNDALGSGSSEGKSPVINGGPGHDELTVNNNGGGQPVAHGGPGDDRVISRCAGFWSCGTLYGDAGDDHLSVSPILGDTQFDGGPGRDTYTYSADRVVPGPPSAILPGPGADTLDASGLAEQDVVIDLLVCSGCVEQVIGSQWDDTIGGAGNREVIESGGGSDLIRGRGGRDVVSAQHGDDRIYARDSSVDTIDCGPGVDTVFADAGDVVSPNCENVRRPPAAL